MRNRLRVRRNNFARIHDVTGIEYLLDLPKYFIQRTILLLHVPGATQPGTVFTTYRSANGNHFLVHIFGELMQSMYVVQIG